MAHSTQSPTGPVACEATQRMVRENWSAPLGVVFCEILCTYVHPLSRPLQSVGTENNCSAEIPWNSFTHHMICEKRNATFSWVLFRSPRYEASSWWVGRWDKGLCETGPINPSWRTATRDTFVLSSKALRWNHVVYVDDHGFVLQKAVMGSSGSQVLLKKATNWKQLLLISPFLLRFFDRLGNATGTRTGDHTAVALWSWKCERRCECDPDTALYLTNQGLGHQCKKGSW